MIDKHLYFIHRPKRKDICVCLEQSFKTMRPGSMKTHGFTGCRFITSRPATAEDIKTFSSPRCSFMSYKNFDDLVLDEKRIAGSEFSESLKSLIKTKILDYE